MHAPCRFYVGQVVASIKCSPLLKYDKKKKETQEAPTEFMQSKDAKYRVDVYLELCSQQIDRLLSIPPCLPQVMPKLVVKVNKVHTG